jgi:DNA mismatch endonuclease (patch repair protein)
MADRIDAERRSANMRRIGQKDTAPEIAVRRAAHSLGLRFRLHRRDLPGRPDLVLPRYKMAVFVHGCFWHRHPECSNCTMPKTRVEFWRDKFAANVERDQRVSENLRKLGWRVEVIWECETLDSQHLIDRLSSMTTTR